MSANILWEPEVPTKGNDVDTATPSHTIKMLEEAFGKMPMVLSRSDIGVLTGLHIAGIQGMSDLIEALEKHESIRIWVEA